MTTVTAVMRGEVRGDRERDATVRRRMTAVTSLLRTSGTGHVLRVVKLHVETFVESGGEVFQRRIVALRVGVADQAHRNRRRRELSAMTIGASFVTRKTRRRGVVGSFVTRRAGERTVPLAGVQKLRVIDFGTLRRSRYPDNQCYQSCKKSIHLRFTGFRCAIRK